MGDWTHGTCSHESLFTASLSLYILFILELWVHHKLLLSCFPRISWFLLIHLFLFGLCMFVQQAGKERQCNLVVCLGTFAKTSLKRLNEIGMGELSSVFWGALMGRKPKKERLYVYKWLIHFALQQGITIALWSNYTPIKVNFKNIYFLITLKERERKRHHRTSMVVQWIRIRLPVQRKGSIPGPGRSHMARSNQACGPQLLSPHAATTEACMVYSLCSATRDATPLRSPRTAMKSSPRSPLDRRWCGNEDPAQP